MGFRVSEEGSLAYWRTRTAARSSLRWVAFMTVSRATTVGSVYVGTVTPELGRTLHRHLTWLKEEALRCGWGSPRGTFRTRRAGRRTSGWSARPSGGR